MVEVIGFELERLVGRANKVLELRLDSVILRPRRNLKAVRLLTADLNPATMVSIN